MHSTDILRVYGIFPKGQHLRHSFPETSPPRWRSEHLLTSGIPYQLKTQKSVVQANAIIYDPTKEISSSHLMHTSLPFQDMNNLLGIPHSKSDWTYRYRREGSELTEWEMNNSLRDKGLLPSSAIHIVDEPFWSAKLYDSSSFYGRAVQNEASRIEHTAKWWKQLELLIRRHYDAVGRWIKEPATAQAGDREANVPKGEQFRDVAEPARYFMEFDKSLQDLNYDASLLRLVKETRPKILDDLYAVFIEMEVNKVNYDYCPRCSQPYSETRFCGQGIRFTPYHKYQGIWNPHQVWSKEWNEVVANRAEALFTKSTEHPVFGSVYHTQRQVDALMRVYEVTYQRGRANSFLSKLRGSVEYQLGIVSESSALRKSYEALLDKTTHPVLLTHDPNTPRSDLLSNPYSTLPFLTPQQSVKKLRIDLELDRFRREQREEGVVRIPPSGWDLKMNELVEYKFEDKRTPGGQRITNWRDVKEGIEKSFTQSRRLPDAAYVDTSRKDSKQMLRNLHYAEHKVHSLPTEESWKVVEIENARERGSMQEPFLFPEENSYRWFESSDIELNAIVNGRYLAKNVHNIRHGNVIRYKKFTFDDPIEVPFLAGRRLNVTKDMCERFGLLYGAKISMASSPATMIVAGVDTRKYTLVATTSSNEIVDLGHTVKEVMAFLKEKQWDMSTLKQSTHPAIEKHRTHHEEHTVRVIGVRHREIWVQNLPEEGVARPIGDFLVEKSMHVIDTTRSSPREPFSWKIPFRNNWAEQAVVDAIEAPWQAQPVAPLISDRMTPKRKIFGYTQHNKNGDFITKEYQDRLRSKQFYANPRAFQVIPDVYEQTPNFGGKWESAYTSGLPSVDRNELTHGWSKVEAVPDAEVKAIEQAIRDISGTRPGNYYKRLSELSQFNVKEDWWNVIPYWEHLNYIEAHKRPVEQRLINHNALPFGGKIPAIGAAGIGERVKYITDQLEKGFGNGPTGFSPTSQHAHVNTLDFESQAEERMNGSHVLLKLFQQKLKRDNLSEAQVIWSTGVRMKETTMALEEWSRHKKEPSLSLLRMLAHFLKDDIAAFNKDLPQGLPPLELPASDTAHASQPVANVWVERDLKIILASNEREKTQDVHGDFDLIEQEGFIQYKYIQTKLFGKVQVSKSSALGSAEPGIGLRVDDSALEKWCRQVYIEDFVMATAKYVNVDIPKPFLTAVRNSKEIFLKEFRANNKWVTNESLKYLLMECQIPMDDAAHIIRQAPDVHHSIEHGQYLKKSKHSLSPHLPPKTDGTENPKKFYHVPSLLKWNGAATSRGTSIRRDSAISDTSRGGASALKKRSLLDVLSKGKDEQSSKGSKSMLKMSDVLSNYGTYFGDGAAMDLNYKTRENVENSLLFWEFMRFTHPLIGSTEEFMSIGQPRNIKFGGPIVRASKVLYEDYTRGKWVPTIEDMHLLSTKLIQNIVGSLDGTLKDRLGEFANLLQIVRDGASATVVKATRPPRKALPFEFETITFEQEKSREHFERLGVVDDHEKDALSNLCVCSRSTVVNYKGYSSDPSKGQLSFGENGKARLSDGKGDNGQPGNIDVVEINLKFVKDLSGKLKNEKMPDCVKNLILNEEKLVRVVQKLILRHLPLLSVYHKAWKRAAAIQTSTQEQLTEEAEEFRQVFEINKEPIQKAKDDVSKADGPFQDDVNLFNQNPERYWKEMLRVKRRMGKTKRRKSELLPGTRMPPRSAPPKFDFHKVQRPTSLSKPVSQALRSSAEGKKLEAHPVASKQPSQTPAAPTKKQTSSESLRKIASFPSLRGIPNLGSTGSSIGRGRRPVL